MISERYDNFYVVLGQDDSWTELSTLKIEGLFVFKMPSLWCDQSEPFTRSTQIGTVLKLKAYQDIYIVYGLESHVAITFYWSCKLLPSEDINVI